MYEAIQKLDEKFELLQARVTHVQEDQLHVEEDQSEVKANNANSHIPYKCKLLNWMFFL